MTVSTPDYLSRVRSLTTDPNHIRAAEALLAHADDSGRVHGDRDKIVREATRDDPRYSLSDFGKWARPAGLIATRAARGDSRAMFLVLDAPKERTPVDVPETREEPPVSTPRKAATKLTGRREVPRPEMDVREPDGQNEHAREMVNSPDVQGHLLALAFVADFEIALSAYREGTPFARTSHPLTAVYLAGKTGLGKSTVGPKMDELVRLGFYVRTDNGQGGRGGNTEATYRPTLPLVA